MTTRLKRHNLVMTRLVLLGLSKIDAANLVDLIAKWESESGLEWTVKRLKTLSNFAVHHYYDVHSEVDLLPFFKKDKDGLPKGPFGRLLRGYPKEITLKVLKMYTAYKSKKATPTQLSKFFGSMEKEKPQHLSEACRKYSTRSRVALNKYKIDLFRARDFIGWCNSMIPNTKEHLEWDGEAENLYGAPRTLRTQVVLSDHGKLADLYNDVVSRGPLLDQWLTSKTRRAPLLGVTLEDGKPHFQVYSVPETAYASVHHMGIGALDRTWVGPDVLDPDNRNPLFANENPDLLRQAQSLSNINKLIEEGYYGPPESVFDKVPKDIVGKISFIQEGGYKLRAVANPFRLIQARTYGPAASIWSAVKSIERTRGIVYTYDQDRGVQQVQHWLKQNALLKKVCKRLPENRRVHSIDLSDATNNFPWELQKQVLRHLLHKDEIALLDKVATGSWLCPDGTYRKFTVGQPLGAFFSFASFSFAHVALALQALGRSYGYDVDPKDHIAIVGDDIVLVGTKFAKEYERSLSELGVSVSPEKCLTSFYAAEFLSRIITADEIVSVPKWREVTPQNAIALYTIDRSSLAWLSKRDQEKVKWWASLPEPLGLGENPLGLSVTDRLCTTELVEWWEDCFRMTSGSFTVNPSARSPLPADLWSITHPRYRKGTGSQSAPQNLTGNGPMLRLASVPDRAWRALVGIIPNESLALMQQGLLTSKDILSFMGRDDNADSVLRLVLLEGYLHRSLDSPYTQWDKVSKMFRVAQASLTAS